MLDALKTSYQQTLVALLEQIRLSKALASAIRDNDTETVQFWLQEGADPNSYACVRGQITHLFLAIGDWFYTDEPEYNEGGMLVKDLSYHRPMPQNFSIMTALRQSGANIDARDKAGQTPLMYAALLSLPDTLAFLISQGADVNATNVEGRSPLFYVVNRDLALTRLLLNAGADVNAQDRHGRTPLMDAVSALFGSTGKMEIVQELLSRGAKTTIPDNSGRTILDWFPGPIGMDWFNPLYWATAGLLERRLRHLLHKAPRT